MFFRAVSLVVLLAVGSAFCQLNKQPAARVHVRVVNGKLVKYTSKLTNVVELNFTMNNSHLAGKRVIRDALDRIAANYGGFTITHIASSLEGSNKGQVPEFSLADLKSADVIVANNISAFGDASMGIAKQQAIQRAIESDGKGYLAFHGSGDNERTGWPWFTNTLHPMKYDGHGDRMVGPVYKHLEEAKHVILQGILESGVKIAKDVPNEIDAAGNQILAQNVPVRNIMNEWYRFGRDISRDPAFKDKVTILLKYDPRSLPDNALQDAYPPRRKGGNLYTYLYWVGNGATSFIPAGHENDELLNPNTGFDGGVGDFDRYVAQTLFYLAGYRTSVCDTTCKDLPIVEKDRLTDKVVGVGGKLISTPGIFLDPKQPAFSSPLTGKKYSASLLDAAGRTVERVSGVGPVVHTFRTDALKPGIYFLKVRIGDAKAQVSRYVLGMP